MHATMSPRVISHALSLSFSLSLFLSPFLTLSLSVVCVFLLGALWPLTLYSLQPCKHTLSYGSDGLESAESRHSLAGSLPVPLHERLAEQCVED